MSRLSFFAAFLALSSVNAFTAPRTGNTAFASSRGVPLKMTNENDFAPPKVERGVSIDQDGKSNVWAIEPKMQVETKSSEEKTSIALFAVGGFSAFAAVAGVALANLPDPSQF